MKIIKTIKLMRKFSQAQKLKNKTIGFVPTMGYLHEGHLSLIRQAKKKTACTIVSIFVNPKQFGPREDFKSYPRDLNADKKLLEEEKVDCLFLPANAEMYKGDFSTLINVEGLEQKLCGKSRRGHFRGVATIVAKLFNILNPDYAFLGGKDFQQQVIIKRMVKDLNINIQIITCPTIREDDGLAMSSRNSYLNEKERKAATVLYSSLLLAKNEIKNGKRSSKSILRQMKNLISSEPLAKIDYLAIVNPETLEDVEIIKNKVLIAGAIFINKTRLIDNIKVSLKI